MGKLASAGLLVVPGPSYRGAWRFYATLGRPLDVLRIISSPAPIPSFSFSWTLAVFIPITSRTRIHPHMPTIPLPLLSVAHKPQTHVVFHPQHTRRLVHFTLLSDQNARSANLIPPKTSQGFPDSDSPYICADWPFPMPIIRLESSLKLRGKEAFCGKMSSGGGGGGSEPIITSFTSSFLTDSYQLCQCDRLCQECRRGGCHSSHDTNRLRLQQLIG